MHETLIANLAMFLAKNDLVASTLAVHRCRSDSRCACSTPNIPRPWPCTTAIAASQAAGMASN